MEGKIMQRLDKVRMAGSSTVKSVSGRLSYQEVMPTASDPCILLYTCMTNAPSELSLRLRLSHRTHFIYYISIHLLYIYPSIFISLFLKNLLRLV